MTDLGLLYHFLGMEILQSKKGILSVLTLLEKFGLKYCKPVSISLAMNDKLKKDNGSEHADDAMSRKIVKIVLYLTASRPSIVFVASLLSKFMYNPTKKHLGTGKRVPRYIH